MSLLSIATRGIVVVVSAALVTIGAGSGVPAQAAPVQAASAMSVPAVTPSAGVAAGRAAAAVSLPAARTASLTIKGPVGTCRKGKKQVYAPSDRSKFCVWRRALLGHAYPAPKAPGYLQIVANSLRAGMVIRYQNKLYEVAWKRSYRKGKLPKGVFRKGGTERYLVTCDTKSGYRNHHSLNNLVLRFVRI